MIAAGYMAKIVAPKPDWIKTKAATEIYSVSNCISKDFCDYIKHWKHNGYWLFNSPDVIAEVAKTDSIDLSIQKILYYELYEKQFDEKKQLWLPFEAEASLVTNVLIPASRQLLGFDVVSFNVQTSPECSPLSCNNLAESIDVNLHCLLNSIDDAKMLLERGAFDESEPGPFRIFAVYSCGSS